MSAAPTPLDALVTTYLAALEAQGYAATTCTARRRHLAGFVTWADAHGCTTPDALSPALLERYRTRVHHRRRADGAPLAWATQANQLTAVRMLCAWAARTKRLAVNPAAELPMPKLPHHLPRAVLSVSEVERVLAQPDLTTPLGLRDRAILEVLYSTGIRRLELVGLDVADCDPARGTCFIREGKGRKDRVVPIGERAVRWTLKYVDEVRPVLIERALRQARPRTRGDPLFLTARGMRMQPAKLTERLHAYLAHAGITKPGSVHIFRHTMATLMHDAGADIRDLQAILGHAQLSTTEIYTHVSIERLKAVHTRTHPAHLTDAIREASSRAPAPALSSLAAEVAAKEKTRAGL